jgi:TRAP-type C4-dicarboxylate transport system permease small subunit
MTNIIHTCIAFFWSGMIAAAIAHVIGKTIGISFDYVFPIVLVGSALITTIIVTDNYASRRRKRITLEKERVRRKQLELERKRQETKQRGSYAMP